MRPDAGSVLAVGSMETANRTCRGAGPGAGPEAEPERTISIAVTNKTGRRIKRDNLFLEFLLMSCMRFLRSKSSFVSSENYIA
jgi:hypothetical protein